MFQKYLLLLLLISTSTYGADIRMPLIDISIIVPKEIKGDLYCGKSSFANIKSLEKAPEKYAQWLAISNKIDRYKDYTEFDNALYKNMWLQINKAL